MDGSPLFKSTNFAPTLLPVKSVCTPAAFSDLSMRPECVCGSAPNPAGELTVLPKTL